MKFDEFVSAALSNDIVCIMDDVYDPKGKVIEEPRAAFRWIGSSYADREIERFTLISRRNKRVNEKIIAVSLGG